ncbi:uncharacterized protein PHALS_09536 [Plasmopara halstedii]|uniref:Uncharacterized protein n=1 Tax=Plasmopara halstedii TaxID=4781 RepID=A0A0P1A5K6_PLAHL|nr:uncharacterized protein PHALS_09536 [Plasmopara halstedii]CEG35414.1 hypothetical protein PHALS_09536 [Plasmopara halstedii]|eukprot:XP_024571783.1 hypothetical protein PHALS_09536 [Plasmopara halstedii]
MAIIPPFTRNVQDVHMYGFKGLCQSSSSRALQLLQQLRIVRNYMMPHNLSRLSTDK